MSDNNELQKQAAQLYNLAKEARTVKSPVEFIALLLLLKKENFFFFPTHDHYFGNEYNEDIEDQIRRAINQLDVSEFKSYLLSISESVLEYSREDFIGLIAFIEYCVSNSNNYYGNLLDEVIFYAASSGDRSIVEGAQPREITKLVEGLCEKYFIETVYNPFAGIGSFYTAFSNSKRECLSQEINKETWVLGTLRCLVYGIPAYKYKKSDSIKFWENSSHDLIVSFPPLSYRIPAGYFKDYDSHYADDFILKNIIQTHSHETIFIGLFACSYLSRQFNESKWIRSHLVDHDILECVISLPPNILYTTSASTSLLIINYNKKDKGIVKLVDGSEFYSKRGKLNAIDVEELLYSIEESDEEYIQFVQNEEIRNQDYILDIKRYFYDEDPNTEKYKVRILKDILKPIRGERLSMNIDKQAKIVKFGNLKEDISDYTITSKDLNTGKVQKDYQKISKDSILLSARFGELKPTYIKVGDNDIYHITGIRAFELKKTPDIHLDYLIYYLNSKSVREYVKAYSVGTTIQFLSNKDLENIRIPIPSLQQQERILNAVRETHQEGLIKESELEKYIEERKQDFIDELSIKKHSISQYFSNLDASINALNTFLKKRDGILNIDDLISENLQITVEQHIESMINCSGQIGELIDNLVNSTEFEPPKEFHLDRFLSNYVKKYPTNGKFELMYLKDKLSFEIEIEIDKVIRKLAISPIVLISQKKLSNALEDIISNAKKHGFTDANKHYIVRITLSYDSITNMMVINIENNGHPFPKGLDTRRFKIKNEIAGKTGGSGFGGYNSSQIIEHYGGQLSIVRNDTSDFPALVSIELPLVKN